MKKLSFALSFLLILFAGGVWSEDELIGLLCDCVTVGESNNPASKIPCHEKEKTVQIAIDRKNRLFQEGNFRYIIDEDSPGVLRASNLVRVGGYSFPKPNWVHKDNLLLWLERKEGNGKVKTFRYVPSPNKQFFFYKIPLRLEAFSYPFGWEKMDDYETLTYQCKRVDPL